MKKTILSFFALMTLVIPLTGAWAEGKVALQGTINVNTASVEDLMKLPGIGKSKAEAIIAYRESHPFKVVSELTEVKGIGPKMLEKIQDHVTVDGAQSTTAVK